MSDIKFPVIKISQPLGEFFIGSMKAKDLVDISYSDVRRIKNEQREVEKYLGIQRDLDEKRVKKIRQYIQSPDATFPTGIILAVDQKCAQYDPVNEELMLSPFISEFSNDESTPLSKIAKVLDGQHRIAAFTDNSGNYNLDFEDVENFKNFQFNVVIFIGLDIPEQANIFATVNLAQTKVNKSLVYDLEGLSKTRSPFKTCHNIAVALDTANEISPLYQRIKRLGVKTKDREAFEPLTQAGFVESLIKLISPEPFADRTLYMKGKKPPLVNAEGLLRTPFRNLFILEKDDDIAFIIYNYFCAVRKKWPTAWNNLQREGNLLPKSNAFKALMRYLKIAYLSIVGNEIGRVTSEDEFYSVFSDLNILDAHFNSSTFKPGSGGESTFYKLLTRELDIADIIIG